MKNVRIINTCHSLKPLYIMKGSQGVYYPFYDYKDLENGYILMNTMEYYSQDVLKSLYESGSEVI